MKKFENDSAMDHDTTGSGECGAASIHSMRRSRLKMAVLAIFSLVIVLLLLRDPVWKVVELQVCVNTGSRRTVTKVFGFRNSVVVDESPLERWLRERGKPVFHNWKLLSKVEYGVWSLKRGCARSPVIYSYPYPLLERFLKTADESLARKLLDLLRKPENSAARMEIDKLLFPEKSKAGEAEKSSR